jgi:cytochrome c
MGVIASLLSACGKPQRSLATPPAQMCVLEGAAARGSAWAPTCRGCHDIAAQPPAMPSGGPNLHDVYGAPAGTVSARDGYTYAEPLQAAHRAGVVWTDDTLDRYLQNPRAFLESVAGRPFPPLANIMSFYVGGDDAAQVQARRDIIAYLRAIRNQPCS